MSPTIAAVATGPAAGGIGVIRLSGPVALAAARSVALALPASPEPRRAYFTRFAEEAAGPMLDEGLALFFQAPHSYTGEDVVELQAHGSVRLLSLLIDRLLAWPGVRLAQPGEFTRRAFLHGRIDLARAEAVADLIAADSERALRSAAAQLSGALSRRLQEVRSPLVALRADLEAALDFPEEAEGAEQDAAERVDQSLAACRALLGSAQAGGVVRRGARVVLFGPVNAGKSTLFNRLVGEARALVDAEPGTTRDALEARLEWQGLGLTLVDTAGLREAPGRLEALGIERTLAALAAADVAVLVLPPEASADEQTHWLARAGQTATLVVHGKADLRALQKVKETELLRVSGSTGEGVEALRERVLATLGADRAADSWAASERHLEALRRAVEALERARVALDVSTLEVVAGEVGLAVVGLGALTGEDASTELLDAIFQRFCLGK